MRLRPPLKAFPVSSFRSSHHQHSFSAVPHELTRPSRTPESVYNHLLKACTEQCKLVNAHHSIDETSETSQALRTGKVVHAHSLKYGLDSYGFLGNSIVALYAKCGNVGFTEKAFNRLERKDVLAWNSVLSMYSKRGLLEQVVESFGSLRNSGVSPNEFTFAMVLSTCARLVDVGYGRQVHCGIIKMGFELSSFCEGALIDMYAKCNCVGDACHVFNSSVESDTVACTAMITGYVQAGFPEEALKVFEEMKKVGRALDQVAYVSVISACVGLGRLNDACELFAQMSSANVVAWNVMISGHAKGGYEVEAVKFFVKMRKAGIKPTRSTLGSILSAIASLAALDYGLLIHTHAIKQGLDSSFYVGSSLINMYAKCEEVDAARKVFCILDEKNIVLWNAMLGGYAQNGYAYEVLELFSSMRNSRIQPDEFTFTSVLSACSCLEFLKMGCQLHSVIIKKKLASNLFVANALTDMYAKSGALKEARKQFELIRNRDIVSWNAIIVGYVQEQDEEEAFHMFQMMNLQGILPDEVSLASILNACANIRALKQGQQVHSLSLKSGLETSLYAGSSLIDMYAKCGAIDAAHKVFSCMAHWSVVSMNTMIAAYGQSNLEKAINLFQEMHVIGLKPTEITFASLLDACSGPYVLIIGRQIHCLVLKRALLYGSSDFLCVSLLGMYMKSQCQQDADILFSELPRPRSRVLWTVIISGLIQNNCSEKALQMYHQMRCENALPDQATFASVLRACAVLSSLSDGRKMHSLTFHTGFHLDEPTSSALIDMYAKCGDVESAVQVFQEMSSKNDVISWNSMIVGLAKNGYAEYALKVFDEMKQTRIMPDDVTFLGVLTACSHAGRVAEGHQVFDIMVHDYGFQPRVDHVACMVDLLGRWGFLKEAEEFVNKQNFESDAMIWATLLGACRLHGDELRGRYSAEKLIELDPQDSSSYVLLANIYAASGKWTEVNSLRREMKEKGVMKLPGCSWTVVGQMTHKFSAGDKSHPKTDEIHSVLKYLTALIKEENYVVDIDSFLHDED
ncbi:pentatricopeptide repeat-containing protein At3g09040, mitochondrial [Ziziphus jujuba]|uniref:Pentatricopeptide repeat-containing protein At3g09040, mitochondrial n=1 Tax=Ziziphus jujuba TaxID=326968 RepID=A0A6P4AKM9_ZIZJJ|nr:pentatricopeptide repeat-containing protein At3g09040, mitochondrial [Ziziphus jujuba]